MYVSRSVLPTCALIALSVLAPRAHAANPWADAVIDYAPGTGTNANFRNPASALGEPTRFTGAGVFPSAVTPFNPPFLGSEIVSIGRGGSLTLSFDEPVTDDALNPFGVDLLIFTNAFYIDANFPTGTPSGLFGIPPIIEVSANGVDWIPATLGAGPLFPTMGFSDLTDPYATTPGSINTDFTRPVNPALNPIGLSYSQLITAYDGSGGGLGIDLAALPGAPSSIRFVRLSNPADSSANISIDALADVTPIPAPAALATLAFAATILTSRRRRAH